MCSSLQNLHKASEKCLEKVFKNYGMFVAKHPLWFIILPCIINGALAFGFFGMKTESGFEQQYTPMPSTASEDRDQVRSLVTIDTTSNFHSYNLPDSGYYVSVIVERVDGTNILHTDWTATIRPELITIYSFVNSTVFTENGVSYKYNGICAKLSSACVIEGELIFSQAFANDIQAGSISYPTYSYSGGTVYIDRIVGDVELNTATNNIISATALKLIFYLESNRSDISRNWEKEFVKKISNYSGTHLQVKYAYSDSLDDEQTKPVEDAQKTLLIGALVVNIVLSSLSPCSLITCSSVANRFILGLTGTLGTALAIVGSFGLISACGVPFNDSAGAMPIPILNIAVVYMLILLSCLSNTREQGVEDKIGDIMRTGGISITITSIIYVIAFFAGASSDFPDVRNFSIYTGCAFLFIYMTFMTYFIGIISACNRLDFFNPPERDIEGPIGRYLKICILSALKYKPVHIIIGILWAIIFAIAIWGTTGFKKDLDMRDLVYKDSYFYAYFGTDQRKFSQSLIISLNFNSKIDYRLADTFNQIETLIADVKAHNQTIDDFLISWLHSYRSSVSYNGASDALFITGLTTFLGTGDGSGFTNDVTIVDNSVTASRLYIRTTSSTSFPDQAEMMKEIRKIVDSSSLPVFAYAPEFVLLEQYTEIRSETIIYLVAICLLVVLLVTTVFMFFLPLINLLVTTNAVIIMVEIIGYAHFWGLTLNSITLVPLLMCFGLCVEFSLHICRAFVKGNGDNSTEHMAKAIDIAGGPIFIGTISSIIGLLFLAGLSSYIYFSVFKVMFLVLLFGLVHSLFLLPIVLIYIRPNCSGENYAVGN